MISDSNKSVINSWLKDVSKIAILTHTNPDGDAIGSSIALALALKKMGKDARVIIPDGLPDFLRWLPGIELSTTFVYKKEKASGIISDAELIFCLDFNDPKRLSGVEELLNASKAKKILIDHHQDPRSFTDLTISDTSRGSVGEMVFLFISELFGLTVIDKDIASNLYVAIMTDTGNFTYASSYPEIFSVAAELMKFGIEKDAIYSKVYDAFSEDRMRLQGYCMQEKMVVLPQFRTAYISLTDEELRKFNHRKGDTEGFVNIPFGIKGILFTALFLEKQDLIRVSFRSRGSFPVNEIASKYYRGGGHTNAAGGDSFLSMKETLANFEALLPEFKSLRNNG